MQTNNKSSRMIDALLAATVLLASVPFLVELFR